MRFRIEGNVTLTVPVEGGGSALKNRPPESWTLASEAARDYRKIRSTLATIYGRSPFFHLLEDILLPSLSGILPGEGASDLCTQIFRNVTEILNIEDEALLAAIREAMRTKDPRLEGARPLKMEPCLSIADVLFRYGPDAIFSLIPAF